MRGMAYAPTAMTLARAADAVNQPSRPRRPAALSYMVRMSPALHAAFSPDLLSDYFAIDFSIHAISPGEGLPTLFTSR